MKYRLLIPSALPWITLSNEAQHWPMWAKVFYLVTLILFAAFMFAGAINLIRK